MTVPEAAAYLGLKDSTVYDLIAARKIPHYRMGMGRGKIVLDAADVRAFKESCRVEARDEKSGFRRIAPPRDMGPSVAGMQDEIREILKGRRR